MSERIADLKQKIKAVGLNPGVYLFKNIDGKVIYVGKAIKLRNRLNSYFRENQTGKTRILVSKIVDFDTILVDTEADALLLENSLIKKYKPKYNILLKDDKSYPWICIKKERFPRVFQTRRIIKDGSEYFGPYTSVYMVRVMLELLKQLFPIRTCNFLLSEENIEKGKFKVCLDYHIKNCLGPCEDYQSEASYNEDIKQIRSILKGNTKSVLEVLENKMKQAAADFEFEEAQIWKDKWESLKDYTRKSTVVSSQIHDVDVFSLISDEKSAYFNFLKVMNGSIIQAYTTEVKKVLEESDEDILKSMISSIREKFSSQSKLVFTNLNVDIKGGNFQIHQPQRGDKKQLVDLSVKNAKYFRAEKWKQIQQTDPEKHQHRMLDQLQKDLRLHERPVHIECFDNSNFQGDEAVSACVVFRNAKPSKKDYRHFLIKTVEGPDDFASMTEVITRRYKRLLDEGQPLPQLIVVDGGKGQLSAGVKALKNLDIYGKVAILGIAKRLEELFFPGDPHPLYLDKRSESLKIIQHMRDEAHRFGITHHRKRRVNKNLKSELHDIKGLGQKSIDLLFNTFGSVKGVMEANEQDVIECIGKHRAKHIEEWKKKKLE
ncbi:MAG: excinuclease ABC subunit UvrC [Flavobacteriales bacterium]